MAARILEIPSEGMTDEYYQGENHELTELDKG